MPGQRPAPPPQGEKVVWELPRGLWPPTGLLYCGQFLVMKNPELPPRLKCNNSENNVMARNTPLSREGFCSFLELFLSLRNQRPFFLRQLPGHHRHGGRSFSSCQHMLSSLLSDARPNLLLWKGKNEMPQCFLCVGVTGENVAFVQPVSYLGTFFLGILFVIPACLCAVSVDDLPVCQKWGCIYCFYLGNWTDTSGAPVVCDVYTNQ